MLSNNDGWHTKSSLIFLIAGGLSSFLRNAAAVEIEAVQGVDAVHSCSKGQRGCWGCLLLLIKCKELVLDV